MSANTMARGPGTMVVSISLRQPGPLRLVILTNLLRGSRPTIRARIAATVGLTSSLQQARQPGSIPVFHPAPVAMKDQLIRVSLPGMHLISKHILCSNSNNSRNNNNSSIKVGGSSRYQKQASRLQRSRHGLHNMPPPRQSPLHQAVLYRLSRPGLTLRLRLVDTTPWLCVM